jgi:hypothetical protein
METRLHTAAQNSTFSMGKKFDAKANGFAVDAQPNRTPARPQTADCRRSQTDRLDTAYLRAAQAYMLISMPTGTSTIFGVFQVIRVSQVVWPNSMARRAPNEG